MQLQIEWNGKPVTVQLRPRDNGTWEMESGGKMFAVDVRTIARNLYHLILDGRSYDVQVTSSGSEVILSRRGGNITLKTPDERKWSGSAAGGGASDGTIAAPMPGKVVKYHVKVGDTVQAGQGVVIVEAMKMQNELKSPVNGKVVKLGPAEGTAVESGILLIQIEPNSASSPS